MLRKGFSEKEILDEKGFLALWRAEFCHVRLRHQKTIASKCLVCEDLEVNMMLRSL